MSARNTLPLALRLMVGASLSEGYVQNVAEKRMANAYRKAIMALDPATRDREHRCLWDWAAELTEEDGAAPTRHGEATIETLFRAAPDAVKMVPGAFADAAAEVANDIRWPAQEHGFLLGMAVAFLMMQSFSSGSAK